ncbi:MAG: esterase family protein [Nocardioidaceae bacterium]|nr:esterase family protein [Nocardioidaceae bacterium]NUS51154.1 esterase family protein [Nocardioidaceae bacterium]
MAVLRCDFFSEALEVGTSMTVLLPQPAEAQIGVATPADTGPPPVLYLLHGLSDDSTAWLRNTSIDRYAAEHGVAVVMPQVGRSFYADEVHGHRYWTFLSEELPRVVGRFFRVSERREDTFVAGLSMGGYGAFKWALRDPSRFAAAACLSGAVDLGTLSREPERRELFQRVYGDAGPGPDDELLALLDTVEVGDLPRLYVGCGTDDPLLPGTEKMLAALRGRNVDVREDLRPGAHEWSVWDAAIQDVLDWLPLRGRSR